MEKQKKQTMIVGALLLVLVAVGAFQFMGGGGSAPASVDATTETEDGATTTAAGSAPATENGEGTTTDANATLNSAGAQELVQSSLPVRDPFLPTSSAMHAATEQAKTAEQSAQPVNQPGQPTHVASNGGSRGVGGGSFTSPYNPFPGQVPDGIGQLPPMGGNNAVGLSHEGTGAPPKREGYKVKGTIVGKHKLVVLEDADGNQILVREGQAAPDGKTKVVNVQKGKAKVKKGDQVKILGLEED